MTSGSITVTWMPGPSYLQSALLLEDEDVLAQVVNAYRIMEILTVPDHRWRNRPQVVMWRGCISSLGQYAKAMVAECRMRGIDGMSIVGETSKLINEMLGSAVTAGRITSDDTNTPYWYEDNTLLARVNLSHRSNLARMFPNTYGKRWQNVSRDLPLVMPRQTDVPSEGKKCRT